MSQLQAKSYVLVVSILFLGLCGVRELYVEGARMSCWAGGYAQNGWLAYCNSTRYGVYDVEAIWHGVEADVAPDIARARVLTLSDSHLQNALSLGSAGEWFAAHGYPVYMLGTPGAESGFGERLIEHFHPHPAVIILDASPYFTGGVGNFSGPIFTDAARSKEQITELKGFQTEHQRICTSLPWLCGHNFAYFRSRQDGHWIFPADSTAIWLGKRSVPNDGLVFPVVPHEDEKLSLYPEYLANAKRMVEQLPVPRQCIVITRVPAEEDMDRLPRYLAENLGLTLIQPEVPGLATFDRAHLTPESSRRWTAAFLQQLEPVLRRCGAGHQAEAALDTRG